MFLLKMGQKAVLQKQAGLNKKNILRAGHPYYLVHKDKKSKVNGWVDKSTFE